MKQISVFFLILTLLGTKVFADVNAEFNNLKNDFKKVALNNNISKKTINLNM